MWFFMYVCYLLSFLSLLLLMLCGLQGYFHFNIGQANHPAFALLTIIVYLFTQTLIIFFFVGMGVSIRDYTKEKKLGAEFHRQSIAIKRKLYPPLLLNMLLVMVLFISGGAVDTRRIPGWSHGVLFLVCLGDYARVLMIEHGAFRDNAAIILAMSGINKPLKRS